LFAHLKRILRRNRLRLPGASGAKDGSLRSRCGPRSLRLNLHQADADALPFADESFDYVLS
jgi:hypothetical protein